MGARKFEELEVWKRAVNLSVRVYKLQLSVKNYSFADHIGRTGLSPDTCHLQPSYEVPYNERNNGS